MVYDNVKRMCEKRKISIAVLEKECGIANGTIGKWNLRKSSPSVATVQKIADYFGVTLDYLMTGKEEPKEKSPELTAGDEKDITKTLNKVMEQFENNENGPLYYDGEEIDETSRILIRNAFEYIIRETKKENKVKYNPNKNKTEK